MVLVLLDFCDRKFESCCVLSGWRPLRSADELSPRSEESYWVFASNCVWPRNVKTRRPRLDFDCSTKENIIIIIIIIITVRIKWQHVDVKYKGILLTNVCMTVFCLESVRFLIKTNVMMKGPVSRLNILLSACPFSVTILTRASCYACLNGLFNIGSGTGMALF